VTLPQAAVLFVLLALLWVVGGLPGVFGWVGVTAALVVTPAVVAVAVGQLALVTLVDAAPQAGVAAVQMALIALLLLEGVSDGWRWRESLGFVVLVGLLGGGALLLADQTSLSVVSLLILGVLGAGAVGITERTEQSQGAEVPGRSE
jgi:hypothetical protein